ncbi:magnesium transporter CorA family protein [Saccharothrix texasensis]|uniref:Magnesium transporter n=1 Tax=Saccharothrix texasensis TaxID=103734 RepID=A0A3N1H140_9PSEU|nr:magnesium transporter CorA family protein [Saccharothrix texasensis]ROP35992.1 magnesium transporter [Saccharothrix texasensis]
MPRNRLYRDGRLAEEDFPVTDLPRLLRDEDAVVWLDLCGPTEADLAVVTAELGLHETSVEDALEVHERPKLHQYDTYLLVNAYAVTLDEASGRLTTAELSAFVTPRALITVRNDDRFDMSALTRRWDESSELAGSGVGFLLHGLLDVVVDSHFDAVQALDDHIEGLEDLVFAERPNDPDMQRRALAMRKSLVTLRRVVLPMRDVLAALMRRDHAVVDRRMTPYYQDVYDHVLRASEWTESLRDMVATIRDIQLNLQGNRLNLIMKKVTGWAAIIAVPTAVTGFYGQNVPYPGFNEVWGFWVSTVAMLLLSAGLYRLFKRRDWI